MADSLKTPKADPAIAIAAAAPKVLDKPLQAPILPFICVHLVPKELAHFPHKLYYMGAGMYYMIYDMGAGCTI